MLKIYYVFLFLIKLSNLSPSMEIPIFREDLHGTFPKVIYE